MREILDTAIEAALAGGARYADARVVESTWESVRSVDGALAGIDRGYRGGLNVRARVDGAWGFSATSDISARGAREAGLEATAQARAAALLLTRDITLSPVPRVEGTWEAPSLTDPFTVALAEKAAILAQVDAIGRRYPATTDTAAHLTFGHELRHFGSSDGSRTEQSRTVSGFGGQVGARTESWTAVRSFPQAMGGRFKQGGWEVIEAMDIEALAHTAAQEATLLTTAIDVEPGTWDVILSGQVMALLLHEMCGHAAELDTQLGFEQGRRGPVTWTDAGRVRFGSDRLTVIADGSQQGGLGTYAWDDEGVASGEVTLIEEGTWVGFLMNREIASHLAMPVGNGCMRAEGFANPPAIRMNNVSLRPGGWSYEALIGSTERAMLIDTPLRLVVDPGGAWFRLWAEVAWEVEDGALRRIAKGTLIEGNTAEFFASCDAVCSGRAYQLYSVTDCAKCTPTQFVGTSHGAAPARFRNVTVGARRQ